MEQSISICPVCGHVYGHSNVKTISCGNCGKSMTADSGYTKAQWEGLSAEKQEEIIANLMVNAPEKNDKKIIVYGNTGKSIRSFAVICCLASVILGLLIAIGLDLVFEKIILSVVVFAIMCVMSWLEYLLLAGFGELIENSSKILDMLKKTQ